MRNRNVRKLILLPVLFAGVAAQLEAAPKLRLVSAAVGPVSTTQGSNGAAQIVEAFNAGDGNLNLQISSSVNWLTANAGGSRTCSSGEGACLPININLQTASLARGTYTGLVTVSDPNALDAPQNISVTVNVGGAIPDQVNLYVAPNGSSDEVRFTTNSNLSGNASTSSGGQWLSLSLDGIGSFRFQFPYKIAAKHQEGMAEGTYNGTVAVSGSNIPAENKTVPVTLRVTSQPIARSAPTQLAFRIAQGAAEQQQFVVVTNGGQGTLSLGAISATAANGNWLTAENVNGVVGVKANPANLAPGSYTGSVAVQSNAANGTQTIPVRLDVVTEGPPFAVFGGVLNSANFDAGVAPGGVAALFGEQFTTATPAQGAVVPLVRELGGVRVLVNDQPVPLFFVSYNQVNFQVPFETPEGEATVRVERNGTRGNAVTIRVLPRAPRIIQVGSNGVIVNQDGSLAIRGGKPAAPGQAITIYMVGFGSTSPVVGTGAGSPGAEPLARINPAPRVVLGNAFSGVVQVDPIYAGLTPTAVGLYQVNIILPQDVPRGEVNMYVEGDGYRSNTVVLPIE